MCYLCVFSKRCKCLLIVQSVDTFRQKCFLSLIFYFILHLHLSFLSPCFLPIFYRPSVQQYFAFNLSFISPDIFLRFIHLSVHVSNILWFIYMPYPFPLYILQNHIITHTATSHGLQFIYTHLTFTVSPVIPIKNSSSAKIKNEIIFVRGIFHIRNRSEYLYFCPLFKQPFRCFSKQLV